MPTIPEETSEDGLEDAPEKTVEEEQQVHQQIRNALDINYNDNKVGTDVGQENYQILLDKEDENVQSKTRKGGETENDDQIDIFVENAFVNNQLNNEENPLFEMAERCNRNETLNPYLNNADFWSAENPVIDNNNDPWTNENVEKNCNQPMDSETIHPQNDLNYTDKQRLEDYWDLTKDLGTKGINFLFVSA